MPPETIITQDKAKQQALYKGSDPFLLLVMLAPFYTVLCRKNLKGSGSSPLRAFSLIFDVSDLPFVTRDE